jgi:hypothetical protein
MPYPPSGSVMNSSGARFSFASFSSTMRADSSCGDESAGLPSTKIPAFSFAMAPSVLPSHSM